MAAHAAERNAPESGNPRVTISGSGQTIETDLDTLRRATGTIADKRQAAMFSDEETGTNVAGKELAAFIERVERLEEEKAGIAGDIKDVFAELKGRGFDARAVREILKIRKQDRSERQEQEAILELYMQALGMA